MKVHLVVLAAEFSTSELRKHRDAARVLAMTAAREKANDLAAAAGLKVDRRRLDGFQLGQ